MEGNPYAADLGDQDPRSVLASTPGLIHQVLCTMTPEQIESPTAPRKWSPREIMAHLADCELAFSWRLRQTLAAPAGTRAELEPFDQDLWARHYSGYDAPAALELFRAARVWNLKLIGAIGQVDFSKAAHHPQRGDLTFWTLMETMAGHDLHHLVPLQKLVG